MTTDGDDDVTEPDQPEWTLSGFGDEIDPDPAVQAAVLLALGARHVEVRSAWGVNVVELDDDGVSRLHGVLRDAEMGVSAIASPIGKSDVHGDPAHEDARLDRAITAAHTLGSRYIRVFSFFRPEGTPPEQVRALTIDRLGALAERAGSEGVVLLHENEKEIYGDTPERVLDLVSSIDSPALRLAWDNANFVQVGARPFTDGFADLVPYVDYLQVKDARLADGAVVPAGEGDGQLRETVAGLRDTGFRGFASLEPHLTHAHALGGWTGPAGFGLAARAFRALATEEGVTLV